MADARRMINHPANKDRALSSPQQKKLDVGSSDELDEKQITGKLDTGFRVLSSVGHLSPLVKENQVLTTPASANNLLDLFLERFVDDFSPGSAVRTGSVVGWRTAAEMRVFSPLLGRAFTAAALTLAGYREQNLSLQMAGQGRYIRTLRSLQETLYHPTESRSTVALIVVVLFTIIEVCSVSSLHRI